MKGKIPAPFDVRRRGEDWKGGIETTYQVHDTPYLTLTAGYQHFENRGLFPLVETLGLIHKSDSIYFSFYYEKQVERHLRCSFFGTLGTDPTRKVDLYYGGGGRISFFPIHRWTFWIGGEAFSESQQTGGGITFRIKGGLTVLF